MVTKIDRLKSPEDYWPTRPVLFRNEESFKWFLRQHRDALVEAGALLMPNGRRLVDPVAFDRVTLAIGTERAGNRQRGQA